MLARKKIIDHHNYFTTLHTFTKIFLCSTLVKSLLTSVRGCDSGGNWFTTECQNISDGRHRCCRLANELQV